VNDVLAAGFASTGTALLNTQAYTTGTTAVSTVGKFAAYNGASGHTYDFSLSDIYVAVSAPAATSAPILTTTPIPVTVQAGTTVTNTISFGGNPTPVFAAPGANWSGFGTLSTNGVAVFNPSSSTTPGTYDFTFAATNSVGSTNGTFNVTVTAAASVAPVITSPTNVTGKLSWPYTSTASSNALYQITTDVAATYSLSGTLPAGLQFDAASGLIYGTPTTLTTNTVSLIASAGALSSTSNLSISIVASTWTGASTDWASATAWVDSAVPGPSQSTTNGSVAIFGATTGLGASSVVVGDKNAYGLLFDANANAYTFTAAASTTNGLTVNNYAGILNNSANTQTFSNKVINSGGNGTWASSTTNGALIFNGGIDLSGTAVGRTLTLGGVGAITVGGSITDGVTQGVTAGSLNIANTGLTTFNALNTYSGATTVGTGANLKLGNAAALGNATGATTVSGTLDLSGFSPALERFTLSGGSIVNSSSTPVTIDGAVTLTGTGNTINASSAAMTMSGVISSSGSFTKSGTNTLNLTGVNTFTGGFTLTNGTVIGNSESPFGNFNSSFSINLLGGNLTVQNAAALGYGANGSVNVTARPKVNLGGGTLTAQADLTLNANGAASGQVTISAPSTVSVDSDKTVRIERMVATDNTNAANSVLTKTGPGTLTIIGSASTVIGGYRVNEGILAFNGSANNGMGSGPIVMNGGSLWVSKGAGSSGQYSGFSITNLLSLQQNTVNYFEPNANAPAGYNVMSLGALNLNGYKLTYMRTNTAGWASVPQTDPSVTFRSASLNSGANTLENNTSLVLVLQGASGTGGLTKTGAGELRLMDNPYQAAPNAVLTTSTVTGINLPDNAM
jgi:autotransporter-associated beta strand protein